VDAARSPMEQVMHREREKAIREALAEIPPRQRMAIVLRHFEGMSYEEIAEVLNTSEKGVEGLLERGRDGLLKNLASLLEPSRPGGQ